MRFIPLVAGAVAAACMAGMVLLLLAQIVVRPFGILIPSAEDIATFLMVAAAFLGAVHAYAAGSHVRVDLAVQRLPARVQRPIEIVSLVGATALLAWLAFRSAQLAYFAYRFHDMSDTLVPVPLWIPMGVVPIGLGLFALATAVDAVTGLRGGEMRRTEGEKEEAIELVRGAVAGKERK